MTPHAEHYQQIREEFVKTFGQDPVLVRAPGRVNLIGEHTDYNAGFVLPAAIDKEIVFAVSLNRSGLLRFYSQDLKERFELSPSALAVSKTPWANYLLGVLAQFQKRGVTIPGIDCVFGGNVPLGAGLSSSAALETGFAVAVSHLLDLDHTLSRLDLVHMAQMAEHEYAKVRCGIMDQFASGFGKAGHVIKLDCRSLEAQTYPLELGPYKLLLCDTQVKHSLASSAYNTRRQECETGVSLLQKRNRQITSLRDATLEDLDLSRGEMDAAVWKRCHYVISENLRLEDGCKALLLGDLPSFGQAMKGSHNGLRDEYEVSCPELDHLQNLAASFDGVLGSRMMGGGFGGCTINLVHADALFEFQKTAAKGYAQAFGRQPRFIEVTTADGAGLIDKYYL